MPFCPDCRSEYRTGFTTCSDCGAALVDALPVTPAEPEEAAAHDEWVTAYEGTQSAVKVIENRLRAMLVPFVTLPNAEQPMGALAEYDTPDLVVSRILVPPEIFEANQRLIETAIVTGAAEVGEVDSAAVAEAQEDYDVRGCPDCAYFFHDTYRACPGCGAELVPAVEVFEEGQIEPDRVVVFDGSQAAAEAMADRLRAAGFTPESFGVEDWPVFAVDLHWRELINRTREAEEVLVGPSAGVSTSAAAVQPAPTDTAEAEEAMGEPAVDPGAQAEAEEDYDVRGCPDCGYFFHDNFANCPGCGAELVAAVYIFEEGQLEPDRVILSVGDQAQTQALAGRLQASGFDAESFGVEDWPVFAVDVPWGQLTDRTAAVEALIRSSQ